MAVSYKLSDGRDLQDVFASGNASRTTGFKISFLFFKGSSNAEEGTNTAAKLFTYTEQTNDRV